MKTSLKLAALASLLALVLAAGDMAGTWKGSFDFNGESVPLTFNLKTDAGNLTGTIEGLPSTPTDIHDGKVDGENVTFWVTTDYQGQTYKLVYKGKISGDQIHFSFGTEDGSWGAEITAKKS